MSFNKKKNLFLALFAILSLISLVVYILVSIVLDKNSRDDAVNLAAIQQKNSEFKVYTDNHYHQKGSEVKFASAGRSDAELESTPDYLDQKALELALVSPDEYQNFASCLVTEVEDGDKFYCMDSTTKAEYKISLFGIAAPVLKQAYGSQAKSNLIKLIANKKIHFNQMFIDDYTRYSSIVYLDGVNVNLQMIVNGSAQVDTRYNNLPDYISAQNIAIERLIGLWNKHYWNHDRPPTKPWEFNPVLSREDMLKQLQRNS